MPPFHETQAYVARIIREFNQKKLAEQKAAAKAARSQPRDSTKSTPPPANLLASIELRISIPMNRAGTPRS